METSKFKTLINPASFDGWGWWNGYVLIPPGNVLHWLWESGIDVGVHWGITFAKEVTDDVVIAFNNINLNADDLGYWMVGFDTNHYWDNKQEWAKSAVQGETERFALRVEKFEKEYLIKVLTGKVIT